MIKRSMGHKINKKANQMVRFFLFGYEFALETRPKIPVCIIHYAEGAVTNHLMMANTNTQEKTAAENIAARRKSAQLVTIRLKVISQLVAHFTNREFRSMTQYFLPIIKKEFLTSS